MPRIRPFEPRDLQTIIPREVTDLNFLAQHASTVQLIGLAWTAEDGNNKVIACGGIMPVSETVGEGWMLLATDVQKWKVWLTRAVKRYFPAAMYGMRLSTLKVYVLAASKRNQKWVEHFGFHDDGPADNLGQKGKGYRRYILQRGANG